MQYSHSVMSLFLAKHSQLIRCPGLNPQYVIADAKRTPELEPVFFSYENEQGAYFHPMHKIRIADTEYYQIQSAYGYGGPVSTCDDAAFLQIAYQHYLKWCAENNIIHETIRFHPLVGNAEHYYGEVYLRRKTVYVDLKVPDLLSSYLTRVRTAIRKAINANIEVKLSQPQAFLRIFPELYQSRMQAINAADYYFFNTSYFASVCNIKNAYNLIATYQNEVVAAAIFLFGGNILEYHLSASNQLGQKLCAMNLLLHHAFGHAKTLGLAYAHLGGGISLDKDDKLLFYKLGFGGKLIDFQMGKYIQNQKVYSLLTSR